MTRNPTLPITCILTIFCVWGCSNAAPPNDVPTADWPQWRYDAGRGAASPNELPGKLHLQWTRQLPQPRPAWPASQPALRFDESYSPVAAGKTLLVPSMVRDSVTAYDTDTGTEQWRFYTDGPVRFAPIAHRGKVYFGSDDGHLYCVDVTDGTLLWRFRGGPSDRNVLGNQRLISTWPIRGGPVLLKGTIYFTAGIWPFMGIFVHAVDAETGRVVWTNSGSGSTYTVQPHDSPAFAGLAPRGHLAATEHGLVVPGGRTRPGCYDLATGRFRHFVFGGKSTGNHHVTAAGDWYFTNGSMVQMADGQTLLNAQATVHDDDTLYSVAGREVFAHHLQPGIQEVEKTDRKGNTVKSTQWIVQERWNLPLDDIPGKLFLKAGSRLVAGGQGFVTVIDTKTAKISWKGSFQGRPWTMLAADEKLFVVTLEGRIYCFGGESRTPKTFDLPTPTLKPPAKEAAARNLVKVTGDDEGYCVMFGLDGPLAEALVRVSDLHLIAIDADAEKVDAFRRRMDDAGLYGVRVAAQVGDRATVSLPPYLANLALCETDLPTADEARFRLLQAVFHVLRPYGGKAYMRIPAEKLRPVLAKAGLDGAKLKPLGKTSSLLIRSGALSGAADWTHNYADAGNSVVSRDQRVKAPLGLLWFGGPSNDEVLPRHGHGPAPQVAAGRLFIEGRHMLRALDIYSGRLLWQKKLPDLGLFYDITDHQPGAGEIGSNYVSLADSVYVVYKDTILELAAADGRQTKQFKLEPSDDGSPPRWGGIAVWDDLLIVTSTPVSTDRVAEQWKYLAGSDPSGDWTALDFDTANWKKGPGGFGYGDNDDRTVLGDMQNRYTRVYLRKSFDGSQADGESGATLVINYDDAFIAYLNGREVVRAGVEYKSGKDASNITNHEAAGHEKFEIADFRNLWRPGRNVLAIEGHNQSLDSSDFTIDPFLAFNGRNGKHPVENIASKLTPVPYSSASRRLVVFDRKTGKQLWDREAKYGFRHNNVAVGAGKLFCIDGVSSAKLQTLRRRGEIMSDYRPRLLALDVRTGKELWSAEEDVFGTFLNYSAEHDVLLQAGSAFRDRAKDESETGMVAYRGSDGEVLWKDLVRKYQGPCLLHHDTIICQGPAFSLLSGQRKMRKHPLTGEPLPWEFTRNYGCGTAVGGEHLLMFRSAAAGFYDLDRDGGTGNFGGFKSGCTSNLIMAGGLLNAPEYTRTCTCNYQNQTSLALVHDGDVEVWTFNALKWDGQPVRRVGINFGAPGDRMADDGTLWLDYPSTGGPSPDLPLELQPPQTEYFRYHSSQIQVHQNRRALSLVAASGVENVRSIRLKLAMDEGKTRKYTIRLHFAEVDNIEPGERVFDVSLQGTKVLSNFDVVKQAGGPNRAIVKEFRDVDVSGHLELTFEPTGPAGAILGGIEAVAEGW